MSVWDELKDKAGVVAGTVSEKISEFADTAGTEYNVLKIKRAISLLEAEIGEIEGAMGKRVYELHRHKKIDDKELQTRCFEIDGLRKRIHENEDEIERLRKEAEERGERLKEEEDSRRSSGSGSESSDATGSGTGSDDSGAGSSGCRSDSSDTKDEEDDGMGKTAVKDDQRDD